jgi:hypothetical protein
VCLSTGGSCQPDWEALGAVFTFIAAAVALWVGTADARRRKQDKQENAKEICAAAECTLAYFDVLNRLLSHQILYRPQIDSIDVVRSRAGVLAETLRLESLRQNLNDSELSTAVMGRSLAATLVEALGEISTSPTDDERARARVRLDKQGALKLLLTGKVAAVRNSRRLSESVAAQEIRAKYNEFIDGCLGAQAAQGAPPDFQPF